MNSRTGRRGPLATLAPWLLLVVILGLAASLLLVDGQQLEIGLVLTMLYLVLVVVTVFVVRRVIIQPGQWLGRRTVRRAVVAGALVICLILAISPTWLGGTALLLLLLLALCQVLLGRATEQLTASLARDIDERQGAVRDRAYRSAYWVLAAVAAGLIGVSYFASAGSRHWLGSAIDGGAVIVLIAMLILLPAMVVAWTEPDRNTPEFRASAGQARAALFAMTLVALVLVAPIGAAAGVLLLPLHESAVHRYTTSVEAGRCADFQRATTVGLWFEARVPLSAEVCWNGERAHYVWGMNKSDCLVQDTSLVTLKPAECQVLTEPDGTLSFTYAVLAQPAVLSFLSRRLVVSLAIDRHGRAVARP
ncbi:MAG: hypothetical protein ACRENX_12685 [Candidatus Dormibacteria bacterium]